MIGQERIQKNALLPTRKIYKAWMKIIFFFFAIILIDSACKKDKEEEVIPINNDTDTIIKSLKAFLIPAPVKFDSLGNIFVFSEKTVIYVKDGSSEVVKVADYLKSKLATATGFNTAIQTTSSVPDNGIYFNIVNNDSLGTEGYTLKVSRKLVTLSAQTPEGLFRGIQTIRQLFPSKIESNSVQSVAWELPCVNITDYPRFAYRGAMLDVARHFFKVEDVERYIDLLAFYKINYFHLHLSDDQGWRIQIDSWPNLTVHGGSTQVGGGSGGYYTKDDYENIVTYAKDRFITIIPEIDMPGHTNAALSSYAELNCNGKAPSLYTGTAVGFSSLCIDSALTYKFIDDVIKELAAMTPGPYIHIGGDEASTLKDEKYITFVNKVQDIVEKNGKKIIGWEEVAKANLHTSSIAQHWNSSLAATAVNKGAKVIISRASKAYIDMKYNSSTTLGQSWAGMIEVKTAYAWDPSTIQSGVKENNIFGVEAPLWTENIKTIKDIEFMAFPRMLGYAEMGWSPNGRQWDEYKNRLAEFGPRLQTMDINFYKSTQVNWQ